MKSRDVVGHKIVEVIQKRVFQEGYPPYTHLVGIVLDNGSLIYLTVCEGNADYFVEAHVSKKWRRIENPKTA